jgi:phosphatidylserine decarboxylase
MMRLSHPFNIFIQCVLPQRFLTLIAGRLANASYPPLKNRLIAYFIKRYHVDLKAAAITDVQAYPTFNSFFIRRLRPETRPIVAGEKNIASPVDGTIAKIGCIHKNQLLQAKQFYFDLDHLLGGDKALAEPFYDGHFATLYLAPADYHRVHMPCAGQLHQALFIPGRLFSVNRMTSELIPHLYSRNERLITLFHTTAGPMAIILIGAMIVGSIQPFWQDHPIKSTTLLSEKRTHHLAKGEELGHFKLGSTVILLYTKGKIAWEPSRQPQRTIQWGEHLGQIMA